jgi:ribonuclease P protein component
LRLSRAMRMRRSREFDLARKEGIRLVKGCLIANWLCLAGGAETRVGVVASRRVGSAVARNRARRLLREAFRRNQHALRQPAAVVLVARASIAGKSYADVEQDYLTVKQRAEQRLK